MINQYIIDIINREIDEGNKFFYFDKRSFKLVASTPDNEGSFEQVNVYDTIEVHIPRHTTIENVVAILKFYNGIV